MNDKKGTIDNNQNRYCVCCEEIMELIESIEQCRGDIITEHCKHCGVLLHYYSGDGEPGKDNWVIPNKTRNKVLDEVIEMMEQDLLKYGSLINRYMVRCQISKIVGMKGGKE